MLQNGDSNSYRSKFFASVYKSGKKVVIYFYSLQRAKNCPKTFWSNAKIVSTCQYMIAFAMYSTYLFRKEKYKYTLEKKNMDIQYSGKIVSTECKSNNTVSAAI